MVDVTQLHDEELLELAKVHSSELSEGYLQYLDQKNNPPPLPPEPPKEPEPPQEINVTVQQDPAIPALLQTLIALNQHEPPEVETKGRWSFKAIRDENGDISDFIATEL